jgi:hypothetical protein
MSMQRRDLLKSVASAGLFAAATPLVRSQEQLASVGRAMPAPRIKESASSNASLRVCGLRW